MTATLLLAGCSSASPDASTPVPVEAFGDLPALTTDEPASAQPSPAAPEAQLDTGADGDFLPTGPPPTGGEQVVTLGQPIGSAIDNLADATPSDVGPIPVGLTIGSLGVQDAEVNAVGALENGEMEVPGPGEVGWYKHGPGPGEQGSAVLAAHIAFDGVDGVFRNLADIEAGAKVFVHYSDGSIQEFEIITLRQFAKTELPTNLLFSKTGDPILTLITCGGDFNSSLSSYDDNVVALAVPV